MKIATWNVNSIKARHDRLVAFLGRHNPDVLCLQELKTTDDSFPHAALEAAGYQSVCFGQKTYNGVAIVSRLPPSDILRGLDDGTDDPQARLLAATVGGVRILSAYVPNGAEVGSDKYAYKLAWLGRLRRYLERTCSANQPLALCGDFNVAPEDLDVARPNDWGESVLCHGDARSALEDVRTFGFVDVVRKLHPQAKLYSWWDYRNLAFPKGDGLRIDHIYCTFPLSERCTDAGVDRDERKGKLPSDHAPVWATFSDG